MAERSRGVSGFKGHSAAWRLQLWIPREGPGAVCVWVLKQARHLHALVAQAYEWAMLTGM